MPYLPHQIRRALLVAQREQDRTLQLIGDLQTICCSNTCAAVVSLVSAIREPPWYVRQAPRPRALRVKGKVSPTPKRASVSILGPWRERRPADLIARDPVRLV
jgi:hypothetical protein